MKRSDIPKCALTLSLSLSLSRTLSHTHSHSQSAFRPALETVPAHFNFHFSIVRTTYFLTLVMIILHLIVVLLRLTVASRGKIKLADCSTYEILQPQAFTLTHSHTLSLSSFLALKHTHTPSKSNSHSAARPYIPHPGILLRKSCALSCTHTHSRTHAHTLPLTHAHMSFLAHVRAVES